MTILASDRGLPIFGTPVRGRRCGTCTICCTLVPVSADTFDKPANTRCHHLGAKGCKIYISRPDPCRYWSCRWLFDDDTKDLRRPDHAGYVLDCALDTIVVNDVQIHAMQVWVDPERRDSHTDPHLRAYLDLIGRRHAIPSIVRFSSSEGFLLVPPALTGRGWLEMSSDLLTREQMEARLAETEGRNVE